MAPSQTIARRKLPQSRGSLREQAQRVLRHGWDDDAQGLAMEIFRLLGNQDVARTLQTSASVAPTVIDREMTVDVDVAAGGAMTLIPALNINVPCNSILKADWAVHWNCADAGTWDAYISVSKTDMTTQPARIKVTGADYRSSAQTLVIPIHGGQHKVSLMGLLIAGASTATAKANLSRMVLTLFRWDNSDVVVKQDVAALGPVLPPPIK